MKKEISHTFSLGQLVLFSLPAVAMLMVTSLYTAVDGVFIARYVGSDALSAINIMLPLDTLSYGVAIMLGTGASAVIGRKLGQGRTQEAYENFSLVTVAAVVIGLALSVGITVFFEPLAVWLGASPRLLPYCMQYGYILFGASVFTVVQVMYQSLFITAGKSQLALWLTGFSGVLNVVLDWLFIVVFQWGMAGAALGTIAGRIIGGVVPIVYFLTKRGGMLSYGALRWDGRFLAKTLSNGSSEMVSNLAAGVTTLLFNLSMMELAGEDGVAAMTIVLYTQFVYTAVYIGFSNSAAPVISYHYGSGNRAYLKKLFRSCVVIVTASTALMLAGSIMFAKPLISLFAKDQQTVFALAYHGYMIFIWNFLFAGYNIFSSGLFTALSNGAVSAAISFLRTLVFVTGSILLLPRVMGMDGIWLAIPLAEALTFCVAVFFVLRYGTREYHFLGRE